MMMIPPPPESTLCKNKNSIFSALGLDRDLVFFRGHQGHQKAHCAKSKIQFSQLWDLIETWGFRVDLPRNTGTHNSPLTPQKAHCATTKIEISQLWDLYQIQHSFI